MAKEGAEKTQIGWGSLGTRLFADVPVTNERVYFDMADLHETWKDFMSMYGVKQFVSSALAKESFSPPEELKRRLANAESDEEKTAAREAIRQAKLVWLKSNAANIRTALWNELEALKKPMEQKEKASKETKAQVEARVKLELKEKAIAAGMDRAMADMVFGV